MEVSTVYPSVSVLGRSWRCLDHLSRSAPRFRAYHGKTRPIERRDVTEKKAVKRLQAAIK
ncbi:hypothetical protein GCM10010470_54850 [Saccharopolyspora taberi]|uniref:Uncharacterized protein n=1 Tax=Saccharopolyspora taberi TaxID=60895 RepID=A0ABN3VJV4_9PSEU